MSKYYFYIPKARIYVIYKYGMCVLSFIWLKVQINNSYLAS